MDGHCLSPCTHKHCNSFKSFDRLNFDYTTGSHQKHQNFTHQSFALYGLFKPSAKSGTCLVSKNCKIGMHLCVLCVSLHPPMLLINSDVMWYDNPMLNKFYSSYMAAIVSVISRPLQLKCIVETNLTVVSFCYTNCYFHVKSHLQ